MIHFVGLDNGTALRQLPSLFPGACLSVGAPRPGVIPADVLCLTLWIADKSTGALIAPESAIRYDPAKHLAVWLVEDVKEAVPE